MTTDTLFDSGISPVHVPASQPQETTLSVVNPDLHQEIKELLNGELGGWLTDVEFRLKQSQAIEQRMLAVLEQIAGNVVQAGDVPDNVIQFPERTLYAEDINDLTHRVTGYGVLSNSPSAGSIAWTSVNVVYNGTTYTLTNGNTALKYAWFDGAVSTTVMQVSNTKPVLAGNAVLLFVNDGGVVREAWNASIPPAVGNNAVDNLALLNGAVTGTKIADGTITAAKTDFAAGFTTAISGLNDAVALAQATADGAISTYFQSNAPWANGSTQPVAVVGDVWYDSDDGKAYRWSGAAGSPANTWVEIVDAGTNAALAAAAAAQTTANGKITTFYAAAGSPPAATTIGDLWVVTDQGNQLRRATATGTASWVTVQLGTNALADGAITDVKVGSGINGSKIGDGTLSGLKVTNGTLGATKLNTLIHTIY